MYVSLTFDTPISHPLYAPSDYAVAITIIQGYLLGLTGSKWIAFLNQLRFAAPTVRP